LKLPLTRRQFAQAAAVLSCAFALKLHYATASADQLRWILAPTTALVEAATGVSFEFEAHAGYLSRERGLLIAASCAGVNFLLAAFLLLTLGRLWRGRLTWRFIPAAAAVAYLVTLAANAARIGLALWLLGLPAKSHGWQPEQLHRWEGIVVYFGFLLLLHAASEALSAGAAGGRWRRLCFPLLIYYATTLGVPLLTRAYRQEEAFAEHALAVLLLPLLVVLPLVALRLLPGARRHPVSHT
jgi:exosortase K